MDEMKDNLIKFNIFEKLLILAGLRDDISNLTNKMKKSGYKVPNIFRNNIVELFPKDFIGADSIKEAIQIFYLQYLSSEEVIQKKVKIINNM